MRALTPCPHPLLRTVYAVRQTLEALPATENAARSIDLCDAFLKHDPSLVVLDKQRKDMAANYRRLAKIYSPGEPMFDLAREDLDSLERAYAKRLHDLRAKLAGKVQDLETQIAAETACTTNANTLAAEAALAQSIATPDQVAAAKELARKDNSSAWWWVLLFMVADEVRRREVLGNKKPSTHLQNAFTNATRVGG